MKQTQNSIIRQLTYLSISILLTILLIALYYYITKDNVIYNLESLTWFIDFNLHNFNYRNLSISLIIYFLLNLFYFKKIKEKVSFNKKMISPIIFLFIVSYVIENIPNGVNAMGSASCSYIDETDFYIYVEGRDYCMVASENYYGLFITYTKETK